VDAMVTNYSFWNSKDSRYRFEVEINNVSAIIKQIGTPPGNPFIYFPSVFGMWVSPKTTWKIRMNKKIQSLMNDDPKLKKFKRSVAWVY
jgi:hypothetical protein